jgi:hypothetical protein
VEQLLANPHGLRGFLWVAGEALVTITTRVLRLSRSLAYYRSSRTCKAARSEPKWQISASLPKVPAARGGGI